MIKTVLQILWNIISRKIFYPIIFMTASLIWILTTNSGLKTTFEMVKYFSPYPISAEISGRLSNEIHLKNLSYQNPRYTLEATELVLQLQIHALLNGMIKLPSFELKEANFYFAKFNDPLYLDIVNGALELTTQFKPTKIQIQNLSGKWKEELITGQGGYTIINKTVQLLNSHFSLGKSKLFLSHSTQHQNQIDWRLLISVAEDFKAESWGVLIPNHEDPLRTWTGKIEATEVQSNICGNWSQKTPTNMTFSPSHFSSQPLILENEPTKALARLAIDWELRDALNIGLDIPHLPLKHPNILGNAALKLKISQKTHQAPVAEGNITLEPGTIILKQNKREVQLPYIGGIANFSLKDKQFLLNFDLKENIQNTIEGNLALNPFTFSRRIWEQNLTGKIHGKWQDLKLINLLFPQISSLKANIHAEGQFLGTLRNPQLQISAKSANARFLIPKQQINVHDLNLSLEGDIPGNLAWKGNGYLGKGAFQLTGLSILGRDAKTSLAIRGKDLQIYNTANIQILADPDISIDLVNHHLFVKGTVHIPFANIELQNELKRANPSKDVIFVTPLEDSATDNNSGSSNTGLRIVPNLYLLLEKTVHFKGYNLDGFIGGKLEIDERPDGLLAGTGRLTIKEGKYRLQGSTRYIHRGRLLFPPGTLLNNPILDIFISEKRYPEFKDGREVSLYVQGTLQKPVAEFYSDVAARNSEILSKLYSTGSTSSASVKRGQFLSNPATLLAGGANPFLEKLQSNLGIEDLSFETKEKPPSFFAPSNEGSETHKNIFTQGGTDPILVLGKSLTEKLYLQFLQCVAITKPITAIRLKYFLSPQFTTSVETGTEEDIGGDLTFSTESD